MENNKVMLRIAGSQQGEQQIATFANRVREIVPAYRLKIPEDETITIVKNAVKDSTYAPWSENNTMEGMYIQAHMINDGNSDKTEAGYADNQLVAIVDLNYRFLTPINPDVPVAPGTPDPNVIVSTTVDGDGCATIDNSLKTINFDNDNIARYYAILRVKPGFKRIPNGRLEMQIDHEQNGDNAWREVLSWENETEVEINCENVVGNLRFVFEEECVYNLTIKRTLNGESWPACPIGETEIIEKHCSDVIDTNSAEIKKPITSYLINSVTPSGEISPCTNTEITVNYIPADSRIVVRWLDIEHNNKEIISAEDTLGFDEELNPLDYEDDYTFEGEYEGYEVKRTVPNKIIRGDGQEHTIEIYCGLKEFKVTYKGDEHVTVVESDGITPVDPETPVIVKYGQSVDPNKKFVIGGDYSVSILPSGNAVVTKDDESKTISVTNVKSDVVVTLSSVENVRVTSITADQIDAMGGVKLTAHLSNDTEDSNPEHFSINSYKIGTEAKVEDVNQSNILQVYDYVAKDLVDKKVISNLEWPNTSSSTRNVLLGVTYNQYGSAEDEISTTQRAETYGYYEGGLKSNSNSSKLKEIDTTTTNWKTGYLVDFGDSCNMYIPTESSQALGLDIYNKDITPYYIPGTDIGENPLRNLDNKATIAKITSNSGSVTKSSIITPSDFDSKFPTYNTLESTNQEHFHILWRLADELKGHIFVSDTLTAYTGGCGGYDSSCGCSNHTSTTSSTKFGVLEAKKYNGDITQSVNVNYNYKYVTPKHKYGRDSISYYHCNNIYRSNVTSGIFKDSDRNNIDFSYPVHICLYYASLPSSGSTGWNNLEDYNNDRSYKQGTIRWEDSSDYTMSKPDSGKYDQYSNDDSYYDYKNKVTIESDGDIKLNEYKVKYYNEESGDLAGNCNGVDLEDYLNVTLPSSDTGRVITAYYTIMSPERQVRPEENNNTYTKKFIKLSGEYNGCNYTGDYNSNLIKQSDLSEYVNYKEKHTTYISEKYRTSTSSNPSLLLEPIEINSDEYLYPIDGTNINYSEECDGASYSYLDKRITTLNNYYPYRFFNLVASVQLSLFYNNPVESKTEHYLHNSDDAKYVACAEGFVSRRYEIFAPSEVGYSGIDDWFINNINKITNITRNEYNSITGFTVTDGGTTTEYSNALGSLHKFDVVSRYFYPQQTYTLPTFRTNAETIQVEFIYEQCLNNPLIGSFKTLTHIGGGAEIDSGWKAQDETEIIPNHSESDVVCSIVANTNGLAIIDPQSLEKIVDLDTDQKVRDFVYDGDNYYDNYNSYKNNVFTGGGRFKITATWPNNDTRVMYIDIKGSCDSSSDPNKSASPLTWKTLLDRYTYRNGNPFGNVIKEDTSTYYPLILQPVSST